MPLNLDPNLSNRTPPETQIQTSKPFVDCRCSGDPSNYCFPYYFPKSFQQALQQNPDLLSKASNSQAKHGAPTDGTKLVDHNLGGDPDTGLLIDIIYSQQRDGEVSFEFDAATGRLSFLTFIDISSLYNDKQVFAFQMAKQLSSLPPHPHLLNL